MASWDDVDRVARSLPDVDAKGRSWTVNGKSFAWDRPLRAKDIEELGDSAPEPPILAVWVSDQMEKQALLSSDAETFFTTSHLDGYAIVLARLSRLGEDELEEMLVESWLRRAPKRLAAEYLEMRDLE
jgi:hypothetical protein